MQTKNILACLILLISTNTVFAESHKKTDASEIEVCKRPQDAEVKTSKTSVIYRHLFSGSQFQVGFQGSQYIEKSIFHFGGELVYQSAYASASNYLFNANLLLGAEKVDNKLLYGGSLGLGAAMIYGTPGVNLASSFVIQPEAYVGLVLGSGWRVAATTSYSAYVAQNAFSSLALGIRFDYKMETTTVGLDN
ncbi:MAG: hypothetical protein KA715_13950 [Xanthomonadaceae bacterium]|nr:hypothetical protein [Xanthomonadaceae bacterium]